MGFYQARWLSTLVVLLVISGCATPQGTQDRPADAKSAAPLPVTKAFNDTRLTVRLQFPHGFVAYEGALEFGQPWTFDGVTFAGTRTASQQPDSRVTWGFVMAPMEPCKAGPLVLWHDGGPQDPNQPQVSGDAGTYRVLAWKTPYLDPMVALFAVGNGSARQQVDAAVQPSSLVAADAVEVPSATGIRAMALPPRAAFVWAEMQPHPALLATADWSEADAVGTCYRASATGNQTALGTPNPPPLLVGGWLDLHRAGNWTVGFDQAPNLAGQRSTWSARLFTLAQNTTRS